MKKVLVIDIGGTTVKLMISRNEKRKFESGMKLSPGAIVRNIRKITSDWEYDVVSVGFPAPVRDGKITKESKTSACRMGRIRFRESARQTGQDHQRRGAASARQLPRRQDALPRARHRPRLRAALERYRASARTWRPALRRWRNHRRSSGKAGTRMAREKEWQREVRRAVAQLKLASHRRLCRPRWRQRETAREIAGGRRTRAQSECVSRRHPPLANEAAFPQAEVAGPLARDLQSILIVSG